MWSDMKAELQIFGKCLGNTLAKKRLTCLSRKNIISEILEMGYCAFYHGYIHLESL